MSLRDVLEQLPYAMQDGPASCRPPPRGQTKSELEVDKRIEAALNH